MSKKSNIDLAATFGEVITTTNNDKLEDRIQELEKLLEAKTWEVLLVNIDEVFPNEKQPRKSFYVVEELAASLKKHGLKQPIILIERDNQKIIFDGECRWRAAQKLGWTEIKAIIIPYNQKTFDDDVLISATQRNNLNSLDLAEAIVEKIAIKIPKLKREDVVRKLSTLTKRIKRQKKVKELLEEDWEQLDLSEEEIKISEIIIYYGWNPITIDANKFPLLKLPKDLKQAIRDKGLTDHCATAIAKINHFKIKEITEQKAKSIRKKLVEEALKNNWSKSKVTTAVNEQIEKIRPSEVVEKNQQKLNNYYKAVKALSVETLSVDEKKELLTEVLKLVNQLQLE